MKTLNDQIEEMPEKVSTTVFDRIKALLASPDEKFKALQASFDALTAKHTQAEADLATARAGLATAVKEAADAKAALAAMTAERDGLKSKLATAEAAVTDFDAKVAAKTRELAAAQGIKIDQLPAAPAGSSTASVEKILAEYNAEKDPAKAAQIWEQKVKPALGYK